MQSLWQDLRYGARMLLKNPGFTMVAIFTLALGIGANTAIFSVVSSLLLYPLPYSNSERLAIIWTHSPGANVAQDWPSPGQFSAIKARTGVFEELAIAHGESVILTSQSMPERLGAVRVSAAMFLPLGARTLLGRVFLPGEDAPGKPQTVILSYGLWQRRFGGDPKVLGQALTVDGRSYAVVGVMPADFSLGFEVMPTMGAVPQAEILLPLPLSAEDLNNHDDEIYNVLARRHFSMISLGLFALVAILLAAVGIYGVMSYLVSQRTREIGIRLALGAQSRNVVLLVLKQGLGLTLLGEAIGLAGAIGLTRFLERLLFGVSTTDTPTFMGVAMLLAGVALLACWIPARRATKVDPMVALRRE